MCAQDRQGERCAQDRQGEEGERVRLGPVFSNYGTQLGAGGHLCQALTVVGGGVLEHPELGHELPWAHHVVQVIAPELAAEAQDHLQRPPGCGAWSICVIMNSSMYYIRVLYGFPDS